MQTLPILLVGAKRRSRGRKTMKIMFCSRGSSVNQQNVTRWVIESLIIGHNGKTENDKRGGVLS